MLETLVPAIPAPARISSRLQAKHKSPEPQDAPPASPGPGPGEETIGDTVPPVKKGVRKATKRSAPAARKEPVAKKKAGRPKGTTKAALAARAFAGTAMVPAETNGPIPANHSPPPYTPSSMGSGVTGQEEDDAAFDYRLSQKDSSLAGAYAFVSEQEKLHGDVQVDSLASVGNSSHGVAQKDKHRDGSTETQDLASNNGMEVSHLLPSEGFSNRPSSHQVSTHHPTSIDHMGQVAEKDNLDDQDISMYVPRTAAKAKSGAKKSQVMIHLSDSTESESEPVAVYEDLKEIPYMITVCKSFYYPDTCSAVDWKGNVDMWAVKLGALKPTQVGSPLILNRPIFAIRTADKAATVAPTIILDETAWLNLVKEANTRERNIFLAEKKKLRSKPKSMLPFYISEVVNPPEQSGGKGGQGKGSGKGSWSAKGPGLGSRDPTAGLLSGIPNTGYLRAVLQGQDTTPYELDRGQRNDDPMPDGNLNTKAKSNTEYRAIIFQKYKCATHGATAKGSMCFVPATGEFVGQHLRIDGHAQLQLIINYMRANRGFDIQEDAMPSSILKQLIQAHQDYLARKDYPNGGGGGGGGVVASNTQISQPGIQQVPLAQPTPAPEWRTRALLNRCLTDYPDIAHCLVRLEESSTNRNYTHYTPALTDALGAQTVGELLLMIYEDVDAAKEGGKEKSSASEVLIRYVKDSGSAGPPRVLATLMVHAFEAAAKEFEIIGAADAFEF